MSNLLGGWRPYSGGKPPEPAPLGALPKGGYENPRFPTIGPEKVGVPAGGYQSVINAKTPIDAGKSRKIAKVQQARPLAGLLKEGSGRVSLREYARAVANTSGNALRKSVDKYNTDYRKQAEKGRAEDILAQRQNATDRFAMDKNVAVFGEDTRTALSEGVKDMSQNFETEKKNEEAKRTAMLLSFLGGLI